MDIVNRIIELMDKSGTYAKDLAAHLGVSKSIVSEWKAGRATPSKHLPAIAEYLGTTVSYLVGETDDPRPAHERVLEEGEALHFHLNKGMKDLTEEEWEEVAKFTEFLRSKRGQ